MRLVLPCRISFDASRRRMHRDIAEPERLLGSMLNFLHLGQPFPRIQVSRKAARMEAIMRKYISCSMAAILVVAATLSAVETSMAGVVPVDTVTARAAASQDIVAVRHHGGALFAGVALGLIGAAIAGSYYRHRYYDYPSYDPYYYPPHPYYYPRYRYYRYGCCW